VTPVMQRYEHDPENGVYGDCHKAALASILGLFWEEVPHFMHELGPKEGEEFNRRQDDFLRKRGLTPIIFAVGPDVDLSRTLEICQTWNPGTYFLLGGESASGCGHTVVCVDGEIVHDPSPKKAGIVGPMDDGLYWVTYIGSIVGVKR
jgi:hypothetical protein